MIEIRNHFRKIADLVKAKAAVAGGTGHSSTTGRLRELIIQDFLRPHLPRAFDILAGVVVDSAGARSTQQDCLIVDARFPLIDVGSKSEALVIAESAVATMEVKSHLDKGELLDSLAKAVRIKSLKRKGSQEYRKGRALIISPDPLPILAYIIAYDGTDLNTLIGHIQDFAYGKIDGQVHDRSQIVDGICVLNQGVFLNSPLMPTVSGNEVTLPALSNPTMTMFPYKRDALFAFYRRLHSDLTYLRMQNYDLDAYYAASELE
jgi:hypothetical protein